MLLICLVDLRMPQAFPADSILSWRCQVSLGNRDDYGYWAQLWPTCLSLRSVAKDQGQCGFRIRGCHAEDKFWAVESKGFRVPSNSQGLCGFWWCVTLNSQRYPIWLWNNNGAPIGISWQFNLTNLVKWLSTVPGTKVSVHLSYCFSPTPL